MPDDIRLAPFAGRHQSPTIPRSETFGHRFSPKCTPNLLMLLNESVDSMSPDIEKKKEKEDDQSLRQPYLC